MGEQDNEFGAAPEAVSSDGWNIVDGGMQRESAEDLAATLAADNPTADADDQTAEDRAAAGNDEATGDVAKPARAGASSAGDPSKAAASAPAAKQRPIERRVSELRAEINSLTGQRHRTRAEAEAAKMELADLQRKLEVARLDLAKGPKAAGGKEPSVFDEDAPAKAAKPATDAAAPLKRPVWKEFDAEGKDWDDFLEAQDAYLEARIDQSTGKAQAAFQAELDKLRQDADATAHEARITGEHRARLSAAKSAHPDFADAIANLREIEQTPFMADVVRMHESGAELLYQLGKNPDAAAVLTSFDFTREMFNAVMASKNPAGVLLALASDPDEFARLRALPPARVMFALGALDASQSASGTRERPATRGASISNAPAPIRPVGGVGKAPADDDDGSDEDIPFEQWKAREDAKDQKRSRIGAY